MSLSAADDRRSIQPEAEARAFARGLGLTNECNLACAFCYRDASRVDRLTIEQVRAVHTARPCSRAPIGLVAAHRHFAPCGP